MVACLQDNVLHYLYIVYALATQTWLLLLLVPFVVYPFAWVGNILVFEKNQPAAWTNPLWAKACDWVMLKDLLTGKLKMNVLVTGGAGYIGSELIDYLLKDGYKVVAIDNLMYDPTSLLRYTNDPNFTFIKGDVRNVALMTKLMNDADIVIPLAALVGFPLCEDDPRSAQEINHDVNTWIAQTKREDQKGYLPVHQLRLRGQRRWLCLHRGITSQSYLTLRPHEGRSREGIPEGRQSCHLSFSYRFRSRLSHENRSSR